MNHDEYTDYSCSTSTERLARDVETLLRSWHVTGSDRHVSFEHSHNPRYRKRTALPGLMATDDDNEGASSPSGGPRWKLNNHNSSRGLLGSPNTSASGSSGRHITKSVSLRLSTSISEQTSETNTNTIRLIRSESVIWTVSLADGGKVSVPLKLALWDGPSSSGDETDLPHSLRRLPISTMPVDPFGNFSTLFGIGQHITLSPEIINDDLTRSLGMSVLQRHCETTCPWIVASILSSLLQTSLNVAASHAQSRLPVFGIWGIYSPEQVQAHFDFTRMKEHSIFLELFPKWMSLLSTTQLPQRRRRLFSKRPTAHLSRQYIPPFVSANILPGLEMDSPTATFWVSVLPGRNLAADSRLSVWGNMLLRHCPPSTVSVVLCGARHVYTWLKPSTKFPRTSALLGNDHVQEWRNNGAVDDIMDEPAETVDMYRRQCRHHAIKLLEVASGATATEHRWGPSDDPIASVHVTVTWNGRTNDQGTAEPLISLPFRIRSRHKMSQRDWMDMEDSVERTLLDPFNPSSFVVQTHLDKDTSVTPLAASQRCILAAMVRCATLPHEILMQHLTSEAVMDDWSSQVGEQAATEIVNHANLDQRTRQLVEAMDWTSIADDMIESWEAEQMVNDVFEGNTVSGFPSPPEESFISIDDNRGPFEPLPKSAPPGRLLSMLFVSMSRLHAPSSMALVWMKFVSELRSHWDMRESLPNMGYVPGLDPSPEEMNVKHCLSAIGLKAVYAAFVNSSEPDPDDGHCLIGQKLQAFNIGIESTVALEMLEAEKVERQHFDELEHDSASVSELNERKGGTPSVASTVIMNNAVGQTDEPWSPTSGGDSPKRLVISGYLSNENVPVVDSLPNKSVSELNERKGGTPSVASTVVMNNATGQTDEPRLPTSGGECLKRLVISGYLSNENVPIVDSLPNKRSFGAIAESPEEEQYSQSRGSSSKQEFYDADEGRSLLGSITDDGSVNARMDHTTSVTQRQSRRGARCPVYGVSLVASGDQLYAPYLQRPPPVTDDVIFERRAMLSRQRGSSLLKIQDQLEIAHRLQKPKLLSDMRAFKAANPGSVFQDFINWYGNPANPLEDYDKVSASDTVQSSDTNRLSTAAKLDNASEAIQILTATRDFFSNTWDEATPCAAIDQEPLFDALSTVEMVLDNFETMHPASLVNQIMAVNLSTAYFTLVSSAGDTLHIGMVTMTLKELRETTDHALRLLARDVTHGICSKEDNFTENLDRLPRHASVEAIRACDVACNALSNAEATVARAMSMLHKFPRQYDLVQNMLRRADSEPTVLENPSGRSGILHVIHRQQQVADSMPVPSLREYILRNTDENTPCQLCVRFGDEGAFEGIGAEGGVMVALTKSYRD